jgi:hypothetical protein
MGTGRVLTGAGLAAMVAAAVVALLANTSNPPSGQSASPEPRVLQALAGTRTPSALEAPRMPRRMTRRAAVGIPTFSAPRPQEVPGRTGFVSAATGQAFL